MSYCEMCGSEIEENSVLCQRCELRLITGKKLKPKKKFVKKIKTSLMIISYILFIGFLIAYFYISTSCYKSNDFNCYNLSFAFLIIFSCFGCMAAVLVGEEVPARE
ncbi:MAG: hypothetical protein ACFFCC_16995 [Promethearchaeota archaeon]